MSRASHPVWIALAASTAAALAACHDPPPLEGEAAQELGWGGGPAQASPYPVDPYVHVDDDSLDPLDPSTFDPTVLSPVAYARYATELVLRWRSPLEDVERIARMLALASWSGRVPPAQALAAFERQPTAAELRAAWVHIVADARGVDPAGAIPRAVQRLVAMRGSRDACVATTGASPAACCRSLLAPAALLDAPDDWSPETAAHLRELAARPDFAWRLAEERLAADPTQPFEPLGMRAWLGACSGEVAGAPADLPGVVERYGDYRTWPSELHPISMAKFAGRRIYRRGRVAVAEGLDAQCGVRETEVIVAQPTGILDFWSYDRAGHRADTGLFPAGPGRDAVKLTPDACMGCHYTFDSRRFSVRVPSWEALQLELRYVRGVPNWRDDSACALAEEPLLLHAPIPPAP